MLLQRELFLTVFYTFNSSAMLVTKSVFKLIFVLSNYQSCTFPLNHNSDLSLSASPHQKSAPQSIPTSINGRDQASWSSGTSPTLPPSLDPPPSSSRRGEFFLMSHFGFGNRRLLNARWQQTNQVIVHCLGSSEHAHITENNGVYLASLLPPSVLKVPY